MGRAQAISRWFLNRPTRMETAFVRGIRTVSYTHLIGTPESPGTKAFALTGNVCNTGLIEVPMGTPLRDIVFDVGGGIPNGKKFKAVQIGGPSGGCLSEKDLDRHMDFDSLTKIGAMIGSGGMVVMDEDTCMVEVARFFMSLSLIHIWPTT